MHAEVFHRRRWFDGLHKFSPCRLCSSGGATPTSLVNRLISQFNNRHSFNQATSPSCHINHRGIRDASAALWFSRLQICLEQRLSPRPRFVLQILTFSAHAGRRRRRRRGQSGILSNNTTEPARCLWRRPCSGSDCVSLLDLDPNPRLSLRLSAFIWPVCSQVNLVLDDGRSLGLMIRGGAEYALGIYITGVDQGSAAECGGLKVCFQPLTLWRPPCKTVVDALVLRSRALQSSFKVGILRPIWVISHFHLYHWHQLMLNVLLGWRQRFCCFLCLLLFIIMIPLTQKVDKKHCLVDSAAECKWSLLLNFIVYLLIFCVCLFWDAPNSVKLNLAAYFLMRKEKPERGFLITRALQVQWLCASAWLKSHYVEKSKSNLEWMRFSLILATLLSSSAAFFFFFQRDLSRLDEGFFFCRMSSKNRHEKVQRLRWAAWCVDRKWF